MNFHLAQQIVAALARSSGDVEDIKDDHHIGNVTPLGCMILIEVIEEDDQTLRATMTLN